MFSRPEVVVPTLVFQQNERTYRSAPERMLRELPRDLEPIRREFIGTMAKEPPVWKGKREWNSERQRRAFFATNGFGRGIPTIRTHALSKGWRTHLKATRDGGIFTAFNNVPYRRFVQGVQAQRMHIRSGWAQEIKTVPIFQRQASVVAIGTWRRVSTPTMAGVRR